MNRYARQILLPQIGTEGQARISSARVLLVGCGALGSVIAEQLVRAGVGALRLVDRDIVEWSNLQRQVLFDEEDAKSGTPKAVAAAERLRRINSQVRIDADVADLHAGNIESLADVDLMLDGTDNVETRYLLNDVSVKKNIPWVYGACVGTGGRVMRIDPRSTACLRCAFPEPPSPGELPTCDTAGVLGPSAGVVASMQVSAALKVLLGNTDSQTVVHSFDLWRETFRTLTIEQKNPDCPCCGQKRFDFLNSPAGEGAVSLCGRNAVQIRPARLDRRIDLPAFARQWSGSGQVEQTPYLLRCDLTDPPNHRLTLFADGRLIVQGTTDSARARSLYARYVGA